MAGITWQTSNCSSRMATCSGENPAENLPFVVTFVTQNPR